jgi:hypothetical protein
MAESALQRGPHLHVAELGDGRVQVLQRFGFLVGVTIEGITWAVVGSPRSVSTGCLPEHMTSIFGPRLSASGLPGAAPYVAHEMNGEWYPWGNGVRGS